MNDASPLQLLQIATEAAHHASLIPMANEATLAGMKAFGTFDLNTPVIVAILGALAGQLFNYALGRYLMRLPSSPQGWGHFARVQYYFNRFGFVLLAFSFLPMANLITLAAGMFATPLSRAVPLIVLGHALYYGRYLAQ